MLDIANHWIEIQMTQTFVIMCGGVTFIFYGNLFRLSLDKGGSKNTVRFVSSLSLFYFCPFFFVFLFLLFPFPFPSLIPVTALPHRFLAPQQRIRKKLLEARIQKHFRKVSLHHLYRSNLYSIPTAHCNKSSGFVSMASGGDADRVQFCEFPVRRVLKYVQASRSF